MFIAAQYGNSVQSSEPSTDLSFFSGSKPLKESYSPFDFALNQINNTHSLDSSFTPSPSSLDKVVKQDFNIKQNQDGDTHMSETNTNSMDSLSKEEKTSPIETKNLADHKLSTADLKYISDLNKKMNHLVDKMKKLHNVSDHTFDSLAVDLKSLMREFSHFVSAMKTNDHIATNLSIGKQMQSPVLDKLLEGMSTKLQDAQGLLKNLGLKLQQASVSLSGAHVKLEDNLSELKKMDHELGQTLELLKELKNLNQNTKQSLESPANDKLTQKHFSELNFSVEPKPMPKNHIADIKNPSSYNAIHHNIKSTNEAFNTSHQSSSEGSLSQDHKNNDNNSLTMSSTIGGISKSSFLTDTGLLKDVSSMNMQDKMALGKEILSQMQNEIKGYIGKNQSQFSISLKPEELGDVKVIMEMKDGVIKTQIVVENEVVKDLLKQRFDDMKTMFQENGVSMAELNVKTQAEHHTEHNNGDSAKALFDNYKESTQQIKLNRQLENVQKTHWTYEKTAENLSSNKEFIITV